MYDRILAETSEPDVRRVLLHLQSASRDRHLPAFERCVDREGRSFRQHLRTNQKMVSSARGGSLISSQNCFSNPMRARPDRRQKR